LAYSIGAQKLFLAPAPAAALVCVGSKVGEDMVMHILVGLLTRLDTAVVAAFDAYTVGEHSCYCRYSGFGYTCRVVEDRDNCMVRSGQLVLVLVLAEDIDIDPVAFVGLGLDLEAFAVAVAVAVAVAKDTGESLAAFEIVVYYDIDTVDFALVVAVASSENWDHTAVKPHLNLQGAVGSGSGSDSGSDSDYCSDLVKTVHVWALAAVVKVDNDLHHHHHYYSSQS